MGTLSLDGLAPFLGPVPRATGRACLGTKIGCSTGDSYPSGSRRSEVRRRAFSQGAKPGLPELTGLGVS